MKISDLISMSIRSLWRRKLRTALTILGVIIGTSSIILMLSIGIAMDQNMEEQFAQMGDLTLIDVHSYGGGENKNAPQLDKDAIKQMEGIENVERVVPNMTLQATVTFGKYRSFTPMQVVALEPEEIEALGYKVIEGRSVQTGETNFIIMGEKVLSRMNKIGKRFNWEKYDWSNATSLPIDLTKDKITLEISNYDERGKAILEGNNGKIKEPKGMEVRVVGLLSGDDWDLSEAIFVSRKVFDSIKEGKRDYNKKIAIEQIESKEKKKKKESYEQLKVKVSHRDHVVGTIEAIKALGYSNVSSNMEYINQAKEQSKSKQMALGGIGIVSFFVAAIGIANTMMMSIYERTREIGVMKVIGAKLIDIKRLFLIEALLIGALGGIVGSVFSYVISLGINTIGAPVAEMMGMQGASVVSVVPLWLIGASIMFSTVVGLASGYFPAQKAMKLSALSAIKTE